MVATPERPLGRMTARKNGAGQARNIRLWDQDAKPGTTAESLLKHYLASLDGIDRIEAKKAELTNSAEFTPAGIQKQAVDFAFREVVPGHQKGRHAIQRAKQEVAARRERLIPPKSDPADAAGAISRMEIRTWLRGLPQGERDKVTRAENIDPQISAAIIEAPAVMTGVADSHRDNLLNKAMQGAYGEPCIPTRGTKVPDSLKATLFRRQVIRDR